MEFNYKDLNAEKVTWWLFKKRTLPPPPFFIYQEAKILCYSFKKYFLKLYPSLLKDPRVLDLTL